MLALSVLSGALIPIIMSIYSMLRPPQWKDTIKKPSWITINSIGMLLGTLMGLSAALYLNFSYDGRAPMLDRFFIPEVFSVVGWCMGTTSITDWKAKSVDRHMMRPLYIIQTILSVFYCLYTKDGSWVFAVMTVVIVIVSNAFGYIPRHLPKGKYVKKQLEKNPNYSIPSLIGASDARLIAVVMAASFPLLITSVIWVVIGFIGMTLATAVYYFTSNGINDISYDSLGTAQVKRTIGGISENRASSLGQQATAQAHSITIPVAVVLMLWLFV